MKNYAVTIGPIYNTLKQAKKTRAVWASSYLFSWMMKEVLSKLKTKNEITIILPYTEEIKSSKFGAGMYADRAYFSSDSPAAVKTIESAFNDFVSLLSQDMQNTLNVEMETAKNFVQEYFNIHIIEVLATNNAESVYPLKEANQQLDQAELFQNYVFDIDTNPLAQYLLVKSEGKLFKNAFGAKSDRKFRSVSEIASTTLQRLDPLNYLSILRRDFRNEDTELIDELSIHPQIKPHFKPHHKYFGVLYADGDNIGVVLTEAQKDKTNLQTFSEKLFEFAQKAEVTIANYGGNGIYLGGEDVLAFIPMACVDTTTGKNRTVFDLINALDDDFAITVGEFATRIGVNAPTLSYGLMLSYYKNPLKEAMAMAHNLLESAKNGTKNKVGFRFQKHSGQFFECVIDKGLHNSYRVFQTFVSAQVTTNEFLSSLMHKLNEGYFFDLFERAAAQGTLNVFFANFLNDAVHQNNAFKDELKTFTELIISDYKDREMTGSSKNIIFSMLRYLQFINANHE